MAKVKEPTLDDLIVHLMARRDAMTSDLENVNATIASAQHMKELMSEVPILGAMHPTDMDVEYLMECRTQKAALVEIARHNGGVIRIVSAARMLIAAKLARGSYPSAQATCHRICSEDTNTWEYVSPGTFKLISWQEPTASETTNDNAPGS